MTQDQLLDLIKNRNAPVIVDARSQWECESGHVSGALHLPFYAVWSCHSEIKSNPVCCMANTARVHGLASWRSGYWDIKTWTTWTATCQTGNSGACPSRTASKSQMNNKIPTQL